MALISTKVMVLPSNDFKSGGATSTQLMDVAESIKSLWNLNQYPIQTDCRKYRMNVDYDFSRPVNINSTRAGPARDDANDYVNNNYSDLGDDYDCVQVVDESDAYPDSNIKGAAPQGSIGNFVAGNSEYIPVGVAEYSNFLSLNPHEVGHMYSGRHNKHKPFNGLIDFSVMGNYGDKDCDNNTTKYRKRKNSFHTCNQARLRDYMKYYHSPQNEDAFNWENAPKVANNIASDIDGDGLYEDVNGDGSFGIGDIVALFNEIDSTCAEPFDFNGDGTLGIGDVVVLFNNLTDGSGSNNRISNIQSKSNKTQSSLDSGEIGLKFSPSGASIPPGTTKQFDIIVNGADQGAPGLNITVDVSDLNTIEIVDATINHSSNEPPEIVNNGSNARITFYDGPNSTGDLTVATVTIKKKIANSAIVSFDEYNVVKNNTYRYDIVTVSNVIV